MSAYTLQTVPAPLTRCNRCNGTGKREADPTALLICDACDGLGSFRRHPPAVPLPTRMVAQLTEDHPHIHTCPHCSREWRCRAFHGGRLQHLLAVCPHCTPDPKPAGALLRPAHMAPPQTAAQSPMTPEQLATLYAPSGVTRRSLAQVPRIYHPPHDPKTQRH